MATAATERPAGRARWLRRAAALVGGAGLAIVAVQSAAGFVVGETNPTLARSISPSHATPLAQIAQAALMSDIKRIDRGAVRQAALGAILRSPLDHRSARAIAMIDRVGGFKDTPGRIMTLVGRATLHDTFAHAYLLDEAYRRGDYRAAVREADIVMRTDSRVLQQSSTMLNAIVADGRAVPELANALAARPYWRPIYLDILAAEGKSPENEEKLFRRLRATGAPPSDRELSPWLARISAALPARRVLAMRDALSPVRFGANEAAIRNGNFEGSKILEPYNWTLSVADAAAGEIGPGPDGQGKALYAEYDRNAVGPVARQMLTLRPGRYRVSARVYALTDLNGDAGLSFACANGGAPKEFAFLPLRAGTEKWIAQGWDLDVASDCQGPLLTVERKAARLSELEQFYLDDIAVAPRAASAKDAAK